MSLESSAQSYEGEWKDDKRHGHGVLKVPGHRTYYGQWEENTKTGYGVLLYNDGRKEEGQWQNGKLINTLKRKKALSLRNHNREGKVKLAHITAIQMSITARSKAELAESRASSASAKFQSAQKCVQTYRLVGLFGATTMKRPGASPTSKQSYQCLIMSITTLCWRTSI